MSVIRLYVDEDAAHRAVIDGLRTRNLDVLSVVEAGRMADTDDEHLTFATSEGRVLYSLNVRDFAVLHHNRLQQGIGHSGIVVIPRQRYSIGEKVRRLAALVATVSADEMRDRIEYL